MSFLQEQFLDYIIDKYHVGGNVHCSYLRALEKEYQLNVDEEYEQNNFDVLLNRLEAQYDEFRQADPAKYNRLKQMRQALRKYREFRDSFLPDAEDEQIVQDEAFIDDNIGIGLNTILYGPPGTGKTYYTAIYAVAICTGRTIEDVANEPYSYILDKYNRLKKDNRVVFTTFHQSYGYEEFIEGIKPVVNDVSNLSYTIEPGVFKRFCELARTPTDMGAVANTIEEIKEPYVFIIDEINRGNISKIFGELITLIEDTKRDGMEEQASAILPYSGESFSVPSNVYILGTMNTADRSIALMDTALRRRFQFVEMMPDSDVLRTIGADKVDDLDIALMLEKINERIAFLYDREHTIGHAFFAKLAKEPTIETLQSIFEKSVIPLLQEYFYEDYQKIQLILGDNGKTKPLTKFVLDEEVKVKNIFKGNADDVEELPEKKYTINKAAFSNLESYKQII